jgi:membrane-associated PAP2 superfamily phosphatase
MHQMADHQPTERRRVPAWVYLCLGLGVPLIVSVAGTIMGAHVMEIVIFTMLCFFSLALVFFYALG